MNTTHNEVPAELTIDIDGAEAQFRCPTIRVTWMPLTTKALLRK